MQKNMLIAVGGGGVSAFASLAFLFGVPGGLLLVYAATLPIFLVGLSLGPTAALVAGISGVVIALLLGGAAAGGFFVIAHGFPAWLVSRLALMHETARNDAAGQWYPLGDIAATLSVFGAGMMILTGHFVASGAPEGLAAVVTGHLGETLGVVTPTMDSETRRLVIDALAPLFPGAMAASWIATVAANGLIAQTILRRSGRNLRADTGLEDFSLPNWAAWPLIGAAAISLASAGEIEYMARNAAIVLAMPYFVMGLAVVHGASRQLPVAGAARRLILFAFYFMLLFSTWMLVIVAALGMIEQWADLRLRIANRGQPDS